MHVKLDSLVDTHLEKFIKFLKSGHFHTTTVSKEVKLSIDTVLATSNTEEIKKAYLGWLEAGEPVS